MAHPLASIMGILLYNIGGYRPYRPPSCLNYGQSNFTQQRLPIKNPIMLLCVWIGSIQVWVGKSCSTLPYMT